MTPGYQIDLFDSTLRDGAQGEGISFSLIDKLDIVRALDALGIGYIEAGNPGSNPKDREFFEQASALTLKHARLVAFGATRRGGLRVEEDESCRALLQAGTDCVAIFGKSWDLHVRSVLRVSQDENLQMVNETVRFFKEAGREVIFDAEHFFDGYKSDLDYALAVLTAAVRGGADCLTLCDTNGGAFPDEVYELTRLVQARFPLKIGIHAHNDGGNATANALLAVKAGATQVQGTFIGFGERCGNTALSTLIPNLQLKRGYRCIPEDCMPRLTETARAVAEIANVSLEAGAPFVGVQAFAHKGGMHIDGVVKTPCSFEHIKPEAVGNERRILMSEVAGRSAVLPLLKRFAPEVTKDSPEVRELVARLKALEAEGFQYESAEASFTLLVRRHLGHMSRFFELIDYRVVSDQGHLSSALIKLSVGGVEEITAAEGDGPVHALDRALRRALERFYPNLGRVRLIDYKVRVLESRDATAARVRVLIQSTDGTDIWRTVGVSSDIIAASFMALTDSIEYKLLSDRDKEEDL